MIPIKNKKKSLEMTVEEMRNFSFAYIEKYAPSKQQLRTYLLKKYLRSRNVNINKKNIGDLIEIVIDDLENKFNSLAGDKFDTAAKKQLKETIFDCEEMTASEFMESLNV